MVVGVPFTLGIPSAAPYHRVLPYRIGKRTPVIVAHVITKQGLGVTAGLHIRAVIALLGSEQQFIAQRRHHDMVLQVSLARQRISTGIVRRTRALVVIQRVRHLRPGVEFEYLAQRERRFGDGLHRIQTRGIHLVLLVRLYGHRQTVVVVTDIHRIGHNRLLRFGYAVFRNRWSNGRRLNRWISTVVNIIARLVTEDRITSHRHEFLSARPLRIIYRVTDDTERVVA